MEVIDMTKIFEERRRCANEQRALGVIHADRKVSARRQRTERNERILRRWRMKRRLQDGPPRP